MNCYLFLCSIILCMHVLYTKFVKLITRCYYTLLLIRIKLCRTSTERLVYAKWVMYPHTVSLSLLASKPGLLPQFRTQKCVGTGTR